MSCYSEVYTDGAGICDLLWGDSFFYSNYSSTDPDSERKCLVPTFSAIANLFAEEIRNSTDDDTNNGTDDDTDNGSDDDTDNGCVPTVGVSGGYIFVLLALIVLLLML